MKRSSMNRKHQRQIKKDRSSLAAKTLSNKSAVTGYKRTATKTKKSFDYSGSLTFNRTASKLKYEQAINFV